jgi:D-cysteine desulfhydrase
VVGDLPSPLTRLPRARLAVLPSPLLPADRLSHELGTELWVKRDDLTGLGLGGNKARNLEYLAGQAIAEGADQLVTGGGPGSNHVQLTAAAAARVGLGSVAVLYGGPPADEPANLRLARYFGAEVTFTGEDDRGSVDLGIEQACKELAARGRRPFAVPRGGSSPRGIVGYVAAAFELRRQLEESRLDPASIYLATGSCGTQAGLLLGMTLAGLGCRVVGVAVSRPKAECLQRVATLARECARLLGAETPLPRASIDVLDGYLGPGYGKASAAGQAAARLASKEGLLLDPTFTAKAMAALVATVTAQPADGPVIFWHTGGAGGLLGGMP